jgi:2-polyprenyl-3-methyl-5-hydroxy-6-metoxy-1,4-benzoquinol methylase
MFSIPSSDFMERTACNLCGSTDGGILFEKEGYIIVRCRHCGLVYTNPRHTLDELRTFYEESYHEGEKEDALKSSKAFHITERLWRMTGGSRLLDIGCSTGIFLNGAKRRFYVKGVEYASWSAEFARRVYGLTVYNSTLEEAHFGNAQFDAVTFFEVIEHVHDPTAFLCEVNRILRPGGVVAISTGNVDSLEAMVRRRKWYYFAPKFHLYYFSLRTLERMLRKTGFEVVLMTGSEALTVVDFVRLVSDYRDVKLFARQGVAKLHFGKYSIGCIGVYAKKVRNVS